MEFHLIKKKINILKIPQQITDLDNKFLFYGVCSSTAINSSLFGGTMKNSISLALVCYVLFLISIPAHGVTPTSKEISKVMDYYYGGKKKGPILLKLTPCLSVNQDKKSPKRFECNKTAGGTVAKGTTVSAWTSWFVPKNGSYDDIMIQFLHNGMVRTTKDILLTGGTRKRAYRSEVLNKTGKWQMKVLKNGKTVASSQITVK